MTIYQKLFPESVQDLLKKCGTSETCQANQRELRQNVSIKRVSKFSPSSAKPPEKRITFCSSQRAIKKHLQFYVVPLQDITPKNVNAITHKKSNTKSVYNKNTEYTVKSMKFDGKTNSCCKE